MFASFVAGLVIRVRICKYRVYREKSSQADMKLRPVSKGTAAILFHTKLYVLGDRFNITKLKDYAFSKISTLFVECGMVADKSDVDAVMEAVAYAFDKLPFSVQQACSLGNLNVKERLLVYMAQYTAWARDSLRMNETFVNLLGDCPEFAVALLFGSITAPVPPWIAEPIDTGNENSSGWTLSHDSKSHILSRSCGTCKFQGVMSIWCTGCKKYDYEVGSQIVVGGTNVGEVGSHRVSGNQRVFTYTCKWCGHEQSCNQNSQYVNDPVTDRQYYCVSNVGSLVCRKCNTYGCRGLMSSI